MTQTHIHKILTFFIFFAFLILGFQNCGKSPQNFNTNSAALSPPQTVQSAQDAIQASKASYVLIPASPELEGILDGMSSQQKNSQTMLVAKGLHIDTKSGLIQVVNEVGEEISAQNFCMKAEDLSELNGILVSAEVCPGVDQSQAAVACAMYYRFPYAQLGIADQRISLGESFSSCNKGPDLCGEYGKLFQGFVAQLLLKLPQLSCQLQTL